jgi:glycosyltransferase involved in cell wall biosynthesis
LFVSERFPYPLDTGGNIRSFHLLRGLAAQHDVTLLTTGRTAVSEESKRALADMGIRVRVLAVSGSQLRRDLMQLVKIVVSDVPLVLRRHESRGMRREIGRLLHAPPGFDVVHFNHLDAALYADEVPQGVRRVLDQHNVVYNQVTMTLSSECGRLRRFLLKRDQHLLADYEVRSCNGMDLCLACSDTDVDMLRSMGVRASLLTIPNGVDLDYFGYAAVRPAQPPELIFFGTLDYDPCERAVWYFCNEILPLIKRQVADARFVAVGRNPSRRLQSFAASRTDVTLTGRVPDIRPHVQRARVSVVPLLSGSGTRLKILEAMAMGIPVVTTAIGVEGISARDGEHLFIRDSSEEFAAAVVRLLLDPLISESMRRAARAFVAAHFGWAASYALLSSAYAELACSAR